MAHAPSTRWPSTIIAADDDASTARNVVLTVLSMPELVRRLELLGLRVAASANGLQFVGRPLVALEVKASAAVPESFRGIDSDDLAFFQAGLTWRPGHARIDGTSNVFVLTQTLEAPRWMDAADSLVPPLTEHNALYYVVTLPAPVNPNQPLHLRVLSTNADLEIPPEVVAHPPHPLLWWGVRLVTNEDAKETTNKVLVYDPASGDLVAIDACTLRCGPASPATDGNEHVF